ncbi:alpha/beta fold hydrolase [Mycobacterium hackensackense]|uniref:alpha/beta fold hydrolase n=1 Tax=Mycobacterium hackensackense TaxID=228909 RepID=UPI002265869F|nr:alpha/beta fold hydrolase [Mycobacterium hackensackense]MCV7252294.1 alpha/beta fold hydrolase [Mycobacterium hackensackense]
MRKSREPSLRAVTSPGGTPSILDVVFIHGLGGNDLTTWQPKGATESWLQWLAADYPKVSVWSLDYPADATRWTTNGIGMSIAERADSLIEILLKYGIGTKKTIFVCHSLGGLIAKQILHQCVTLQVPRWRTLATSTLGVVFLATPHDGSSLANFSKLFPLWRPTRVTLALTANCPHLKTLGDWYRQNADTLDIETAAYAESEKYRSLLIVDQSSANPGIKNCISTSLDANHLSIAKPGSRKSPTYLHVSEFIERQIIRAEYLSGLYTSVPAHRSEHSVTQRIHDSAPQVRAFGGILANIGDFVGREKETETVNNFLTSDRSGICILHGFGGCGKSALLKKIISSHNILSNHRSPTDSFEHVFLWSFSQDRDLNHFFEELLEFVSSIIRNSSNMDGVTTQARSFLDLPDQISRIPNTILLILDGLETVAVDDIGSAERDGAVAVPALRVILQRSAEEGIGKLKILCTSRVVPPELTGHQIGKLKAIDLSRLPAPEGAELLMRKGVRGRRRSLFALVERLRNHAYTVSLMGDLLRQAYRGDVRQAERVILSPHAFDAPIVSILNWYEKQLSLEELTYLKTVSLFRSAVTAEDIAALVPHLLRYQGVSTPRNDLRIAAAKLHALGLLFESFEADSGLTFKAMHPVLREYFYTQITDPAEFHQHAGRILLANLPERPNISNSRQLAVLQELVYQALGSRDPNSAWRIYQDRIGGYPRLGYEISDHPTGTSVIDMFLEQSDLIVEALPGTAVCDLYVDGALYLKNEGRLDDSIEMLRQFEYITPALEIDDDRPMSALLVRAGIQLLRGDITGSEASINSARRALGTQNLVVPESAAARIEQEFLTRTAAVETVRADGEYIAKFERAATITLAAGSVPHDFGPIRHVWALMNRGEHDIAESVAVAAVHSLEQINAHMLVQRLNVTAALNASWANDGRAMDYWASRVADWALKADIHVEILTWQQRGVAALQNGNLAEAEVILNRGSSLAGDSGYLLEWLDMTAARAYVALRQRRFENALTLSESVVCGDAHTYVAPLLGAASPPVKYVWPLATAVRIRQACGATEPILAEGADSQVHRLVSPVLRSNNTLLRQTNVFCDALSREP